MHNKLIFIIVILAGSCYASTINDVIGEQYNIAVQNWQDYHHTISGEEVNMSKVRWIVETFYDYVGDNISYALHIFPRPYWVVWQTKEGDCTDQAVLLQYMLGRVNVTSRLVHGFCDGKLHDWLEYKDGGWATLETYRCESLIKIGRGIW